MRLFAGLPLPPDVADSLVGALAPARSLYPRARWVPASNLHVTLRFFGDVDDAACAALGEVMAREELRRAAIRCRLGHVGQFPPRGSPKVLWAGLDRGSPEVHALWEALMRILSPLEGQGGPLHGLPRDNRDFTPHITVARSGNALLRPLDWAEKVRMPDMDFEITECILYQSLLGSGGARYVPMKKALLGEGES